MRAIFDKLLRKVIGVCSTAAGRGRSRDGGRKESSPRSKSPSPGEETYDPYIKLGKLPRFTPGRVLLGGWDLEYLDAPALQNSFDVLVLRGWNDFFTDKINPVILDCGANIGISVLRYKMLYPDARITAFEPDPCASKVLRRNLYRNGAQDVRFVQAAIWTTDGQMNFFQEGADGSRLVPSDSNWASLITVRTVNFCDYITEEIDLVKMDIEGAEFAVIPHIGDRLLHVRNMIVECHLNSGEPEKFASLLNCLGSAGFHVGINSYGHWRDLVRKPPKAVNEFDQYVMLAAWREG